MIKKENLIFTNLYGFNEPSINFAMKRVIGKVHQKS